MHTDGLQLCEWGASSSYGATQCGGLSGGCQGSYNTNCNPDSIWSGAQTDIGYHDRFYLNTGVYGHGGYPDGNAFSVRCVLGFEPHFNKAFTKAGIDADCLQLCDEYESSKYGAAWCQWLGGGCQGALDNGNCYPYHIWSGSSDGTDGHYHDRYLLYGAFDTNAYLPAYAFGVRCVLDLTYFLSEFQYAKTKYRMSTILKNRVISSCNTTKYK